MRGVNFQGANLRNTNFRGTQLAGASFKGADMGVTILRETDLRRVDLSGVDLTTTLLPRGYKTRPAHRITDKVPHTSSGTRLRQISYFPVTRDGVGRLRLEPRRRISIPRRLIFWLSVESGI